MRRKPCPHCEKGELLVVKAEVVRNEQAQREEHTTTYVCEKCGKPTVETWDRPMKRKWSNDRRA